MDLLDRLLGHDAWTTRELLLRCQGLSDAQLDQQFDLGHRTVRATLLHIIRNVEVWSDLMAGQPARANAGEQPEGRSVSAMIARLERAASDLESLSRAVAVRSGWDEQWIDTLDDPPAKKTYGGGIAHVITHSMHHRAQVLHFLRRLGVENLPEGDVLSWEQQLAPVQSGTVAKSGGALAEREMVRVRPYEDRDQQAVVALWNEVLPDSAPHNDPALAIRKKREVERDLFFVADRGVELLGTVMGGYDGHRGWVYSVAVLPQLRRQGIGARLIRRLEAALVERGCLKVNLQVRSSNADVIAFYEKLGYAVEDRISMGKRLYS